MAYTIYLDGIQFPIPPSKIQVKINNQNKTVNLINNGEINLLKSAGLTDIDFELRIPQTRYAFASYPEGFKDAAYFLEKLEGMKVTKKSFQFICSRSLPDGTHLFDTNMKVSLEDYEISEDAKEGFDLLVSINMKQFIAFGTKKIKIKKKKKKKIKAKTKSVRSAESAPKKKSHKVAAGDTLSSIAKKYLDDGSRYKDIYNLNKSSMDKRNKGTGNSKYTIYTGQVLLIPTT